MVALVECIVGNHGIDQTGSFGLLRGDESGGRSYDLDVDPHAQVGFLAGAGYGGDHGRDCGTDWTMIDNSPLDGSVTPRQLTTPMTDRLTRFRCNGEIGYGILEFAHTRNGSYTYQPSLTQREPARLSDPIPRVRGSGDLGC